MTRPSVAGKAAPGPKPRLSRDEIVDVALRILGEDGTAGLSLRRLGHDLGVTAMSLYGYFASRQDLEDAVVARLMPAPPTAPWEGHWQDELRRYVTEIHDVFVAQPEAARFLAARTVNGEALDVVREHLLVLLVAAGLSDGDAVSAVGALSRYLMGCVVVETGRRQSAGVEEGERLGALPAGRFPALRAVAGKYSGRDSVESTHFGLDLIIEGLHRMTDDPAPGHTR